MFQLTVKTEAVNLTKTVIVLAVAAAAAAVAEVAAVETPMKYLVLAPGLLW